MGKPSERGFTMLEILMATAILSVVTAGVLALVASTHQSYTNERSKHDAIWQGRGASDLMVRELRLAGYPPQNRFSAALGHTSANSNLVAATFLTAEDGQVVFEADLDDDGVVERVEYRLNGTSLERSAVSKNDDGTAPPPQYATLATEVDNGGEPLFRYATDPFSMLAFPGNIRAVQIVLLLQTPDPDPRTLQRQTLRFEAVAQRQNPDR